MQSVGAEGVVVKSYQLSNKEEQVKNKFFKKGSSNAVSQNKNV
jgi:hypothetical protein